MDYLGHGGLQDHVLNRERSCVERGHHQHQHVRSARGAVRGEVEQHTHPILVIGSHWQNSTWRQKERPITDRDWMPC